MRFCRSRRLFPGVVAGLGADWPDTISPHARKNPRRGFLNRVRDIQKQSFRLERPWGMVSKVNAPGVQSKDFSCELNRRKAAKE